MQVRSAVALLWPLIRPTPQSNPKREIFRQAILFWSCLRIWTTFWGTNLRRNPKTEVLQWSKNLSCLKWPMNSTPLWKTKWRQILWARDRRWSKKKSQCLRLSSQNPCQAKDKCQVLFKLKKRIKMLLGVTLSEKEVTKILKHKSKSANQLKRRLFLQ